MKQKKTKGFIISITVFNFDTKTKSRFVRISVNGLFNFKRLPIVYKTIYQKENDKMYILLFSFFTGYK